MRWSASSGGLSVIANGSSTAQAHPPRFNVVENSGTLGGRGQTLETFDIPSSGNT